MLGVATVQKMKSRAGNTRVEIIAGAHSLFLDLGYHGTSILQIASQAGIALGGINNHFDCKEDIFVSVLDNYHPYHEIYPILRNAQGESVDNKMKKNNRSMGGEIEC